MEKRCAGSVFKDVDFKIQLVCRGEFRGDTDGVLLYEEILAMAVDMKEMIAKAVTKLLFDKKVKRLTVKDIVEECHITRQAFYYHFADIPEVLQWILQQKGEQMLQEYPDFEDAESRLRYFFVVAVNVMPYVKKGIQTNYGEEIEQLISRQALILFESIAEKEGVFQTSSSFERQLILRYHSQAVMGILRTWSEKDSQDLDEIVHTVFLILSNNISSFYDDTK